MGHSIAVDHHRRKAEAGPFHQFPGVEPVHETVIPFRPLRLQQLDYQPAPSGHVADQACPHSALLPRLEPDLARVTPTGGVASHVGRPAEASDPVDHGGGAVAVAVDLQCRPDEGIDGVMAGALAEGAVRSQLPFRADEEDVGAGRDIILRSNLGAE